MLNNLKYVDKRVICRIDTDSKEFHVFKSGLKISLQRRVNNFNRRITEAVNATVISSDYIPVGAEILVHHNSTHPTYQIFNYKNLSGDDEASTVKYFSLPYEDCYVYRMSPKYEWTACQGFAIGLRVFQPYEGPIQGIEPTQIPNLLYLTSGEFKDEVVQTLKNCDYEIVYQGAEGREERLIRCRHFEGEDLTQEQYDREEIVCVRHDLTEKVKSGKLLLGLEVADMKPVNIYL